MFWLDEGQAMPAEWFADAEAGQDAWHNHNVYLYQAGPDPAARFEVLPFAFAGHRYLMYFDSMAHALPGYTADEMDAFIAVWAGRFRPQLASARLVKFMRADAGQDTLYTPAAWKLGNPGLIYQFGEFLIELLAYYVRLCPDIAELFYIPASGLARFYDRVARNHADQLAAMRLVRIHHPDLEESGYVGYAKQA